MNPYEVDIVSQLLKKYYKRKAGSEDGTIKRRIDLSPSKVLKDYAQFIVSISEKEKVDQAITHLKSLDFITVKYLKYSSDVEKIILNIDAIHALEDYALTHLAITPRSFLANELRQIISIYKGKSELVDYYIQSLNQSIASGIDLDITKEKDILRALLFLSNNYEAIYIREASLLIYGDSKYLETNRKAQLNQILKRYIESKSIGIDDEEENLLERFNIIDINQEICIKGNCTITLSNGNCIDLSGLSGGLSLSNKDIDLIQTIKINNHSLMTVENKTSFLRLDKQSCMIYLGGFATKAQIAFLKKIHQNNPLLTYYHFGDIDAGGFWIHKKLCEQTGINFNLFSMSENELKDSRYQAYCLPLTANDISRLNRLKDDYHYRQCIDYMLKNNVKLEQEIISYHLMKQKSN